MSMWTGKSIGNYQIAEEIGQGGMAVVCRAYQKQLERWVAIKIMQVGEGAGADFLERFRREARAIAALRHPNILTIYDYGEEHGIAYIVMEYIAGGTLKAHLTGQPMDWSDAAALIIPVGRALAYAHSEGVIHRDVKPANILLARPDWPMLADFGLVKMAGQQRGVTRPGISVGTPAYFSPEQAAGADVDQRSDIYSLGVVLYQLLTGHLPFEADSPIEMMLRRLHEPPPPPRRLNPAISTQLEGVILRALAREPDSRYPTMDAFVNDLALVPGAAGRVTPSAPGMTATTRLGGFTPVAGPRLVIAGSGVTLTLPQKGEVLIGRGDVRTAPLPDVDLGPYGGGQAGVSRRHARLLYSPDGWMIEDLHSTNGTFLNGAPVPPGKPMPLQTGDLIRCSQTTLIFYEE